MRGRPEGPSHDCRTKHQHVRLQHDTRRHLSRIPLSRLKGQLLCTRLPTAYCAYQHPALEQPFMQSRLSQNNTSMTPLWGRASGSCTRSVPDCCDGGDGAHASSNSVANTVA